MEIDVWSDVVCPWCYVGRRRLQQALAADDALSDVTIRHRAFQLQPDAPHDHTEPTAEHLAKKYNVSAEQVQQMQQNVIEAANSVGLTFNLGGTLSGNTEAAHRLLLWADESGRQDELLENMFAAYFTNGRSLFDHESLLAIVSETGLDVSAAKNVLESNAFTAQVRDDAQLASQLGANGVPFFVFDMKYGISGAQPAEVFIQTLEAAKNVG